MKKNPLVGPVVKWVGGKRQLLDDLVPMVPKEFTTYCEPFLGGAAMLLTLQPEKARVNDINPELINMYEVIRDDVEGLIAELQKHRNEAEYFYAVRDWDRDKKKYARISKVKKAARLLFLNKTCYNGLFRVNSRGEFNTPFGRYKNPNIVNAETLRAVSEYFNRADIVFSCKDYAEVLEELPEGSFVYLDPPYDPVSETASFTSYAKEGFGRSEQVRLRDCCNSLHQRQIKFVLSNSSTPFINELYSDYSLKKVKAKRAVNSVAAKRGEILEVVVRNYGKSAKKQK